MFSFCLASSIFFAEPQPLRLCRHFRLYLRQSRLKREREIPKDQTFLPEIAKDFNLFLKIKLPTHIYLL